MGLDVESTKQNWLLSIAFYSEIFCEWMVMSQSIEDTIKMLYNKTHDVKS